MLLAGAARADTAATETVALSEEFAVQVRNGRDLALLVRPRGGEDWESVAVRVSGSPEVAAALRAWNGYTELDEAPLVEVPLPLLRNEYRALVLVGLFPEDTWEGDDRIHVVRRGLASTYAAGLWQVAEWFTGRGDRFEALMRANAISTPELTEGQRIRIPAEALHPGLHFEGRSDDGALAFARDGRGRYAGYRLRKGEALYSSVVVRFTGRTSSEDVVDLAARIAARSGIPDLHDIPVGWLVKIPLEDLEPEFLPADHPRRREAEARRAEIERAIVAGGERATSGLEGVIVILDPGHGGRDLGTMANGLWEHDYVYDIAVRLKNILERRSTARVFMTLADDDTGFVPSSGDRIAANHAGTIQTNPPYIAKNRGDARYAVNLRWYLANAWYRDAVSDGHRSDRVVFLSIHADSRHPSLSGAMVYVPGASYRTGTCSHRGRPYDQIREVREKRSVSFGKDLRIRSEAASTRLARALLSGLRAEGMPIPPDERKPIRDKIIRGRKRYVPAVIRCNQVPSKVLVEVLNLANAADAKLLGRAADRDRAARGLARGLFEYFGEEPPVALVRAASDAAASP